MTRLFNPNVIPAHTQRLFHGETNGIMNLADTVYDWSKKIIDHMNGNFWLPTEISLADDKLQYEHLTDKQKAAFDNTISFLVFLDSLQTNNLPNIADVVTLSEIRAALVIQTYQETIHSMSYGYILESVVSAEKRQHIYNIAVTNEHLIKRNQYIADLYQDFQDNEKDIVGIYKVCLANFLLESLYFYTGFAFFYNLCEQGKMTGVGTEIKYINRDELSHVTLFKNILNVIKSEYGVGNSLDEYTISVVKEAVEQEKAWATYCYTDVEGMSVTALHKYVEYLADDRLKMLGLTPIYNVKDNPLPFIARYTKFNSTKTDFFEEKVINYAKGTVNVDELDDIDF